MSTLHRFYWKLTKYLIWVCSVCAGLYTCIWKHWKIMVHIFSIFQLNFPQRSDLVASAKTKAQIRCTVTEQLTSTFDFATLIVQCLFFLNPKFQASSRLMWLDYSVCVGPGWNPSKTGFSYAAHIMVCSLYSS